MSDRFPQDRYRDRKEKSEQLYKDARETLSENEAELRNRSDEPWKPDQHESEEARDERLRAEAGDRLKEVQREMTE